MRNTPIRRSLLAGLALHVLVLAGCGSDGPAEDPPEVAAVYREKIDQLLATGPTPLTQSTLEDYYVSDAELAQAQDEFRTCFDDWSDDAEVEFNEDGGRTVGPVPQGEAEQIQFDEFVNDCARSLDNIEMFYFDMRRNPEGLDYPQLVRRCFGENDVPDGAELSDDEFRELILGGAEGQVYQPQSEAGRECIQDPYS